MEQRNYAIGAIVGIISAGLIGDFFLRTKYFLQIFNINFILLCLDIFMFSTSQTTKKFTPNYLFYLIGFALASNDVIYLILLPMLFAKQHSEQMAMNSRF